MSNLAKVWISLTLLVSSESYSSIIYSNDFDAANSLDDFYVGEMGGSEVRLQDGQVVIAPGAGFMQRGFIALDTRTLPNGYSPKLSENSEITWAFNISNSNGRFNNLFGFNLFSSGDPSDPMGYGYSFNGGGYVRDRMVFSETALARSPFGPIFNILIDIEKGLSPEPEKGAFKINYSAETSLWSVYFESGSNYIDPLSIDTLLGQVSSSKFTNNELPYMIFSGYFTGTTYIDNFSISTTAVPAPGSLWLLLMALCGIRARR